jgi:ribosomal protein L5
MTSYNLDFFLEHFEDVCPEDFEGFTQRHFDRIGNMFFALEADVATSSETHPASPLVETSPA